MSLRSEFFYKGFLSAFGRTPTPCQNGMFSAVADLLCSTDVDTLVVNGYAGTGKTTAISSVISFLDGLKMKCVLLAPTGRAAKVLASYSNHPAFTIHKHIYRQKSVSDDGRGRFTICPNKSINTLYVVDEVSLIGIDNQQSGAIFGSGNLLDDLFSFVRSGTDCRLILVGDGAQLPPIGLDTSPALTRDYIEGYGGVAYVTLSTVVRQAEQSGILHCASSLREMICDSCPGDLFEDVKLDIKGYGDVERVLGSELLEKLTDAYGKYGEDQTIVLCRSNKRAIRYNLGIRSRVQFREERLVKGDRLMIVKNCYQFLDDVEELDYIANGDIADLQSISHYVDRYGLHFADARLTFPDYNDLEINAKVCLDTLESESPSLTYEQQNALYAGVDADYSHIKSKAKRYAAVREDRFFNAMQLKYANAITGHKSQGGQWRCVFIDNPFWQDVQTLDDIKWLYTAMTRAVEKVYLVNFRDLYFEGK